MTTDRSRPEQKKPATVSPGRRTDSDVAARISGMTARVFSRLEGWARMALIATAGLGVVTWLAALAAFRHSTSWGVGPAIVVLGAALIPAAAAWLLARRARAVHQGVAGLETEIISALRNPTIGAGLRSFLDDDDDTDDGRAGVARLAKGAMGIRSVIRQHRDTFGQLAGAVRAMLLSPATLLVITVGMVVLGSFLGLFLLIAIF